MMNRLEGRRKKELVELSVGVGTGVDGVVRNFGVERGKRLDSNVKGGTGKDGAETGAFDDQRGVRGAESR